MTQAPYTVDQLRVGSGAVTPATVALQAITQALLFTDVANPAGLTLAQLAGLGTVTGVYVVGVAGSGAQYNTIQSAVDAVPADASLLAPAVILIMPGVYAEQVVVEKNGITLHALGRVELAAPASGPTVIVRGAVASVPRWLRVEGVTVTNAYNGQACVQVTGGAGSRVGQDGIYLQECQLQPTGIGGYTVTATAINNLYLQGCTSDGVPGTASMRVTQCARLLVAGGSVPALQADYDVGGAVPFVSGSRYELSACTGGALQSTLTGGGEFVAMGGTYGDAVFDGDRAVAMSRLQCGTLTLNGTVAATCTDVVRGAASGTGTLDQNRLSGSVGFSISASEAVVFECARSDGEYGVYLDAGVPEGAWVGARDAAGFTINFGLPVTATVRWQLVT